jgi:hypothetical protein
VTDYVDLDHQKISTLAFFPIASIDPESVLNWLENLDVERAVLKHFRVGSFLHSKFVGGKRERDRIRVVPISRVTNVREREGKSESSKRESCEAGGFLSCACANSLHQEEFASLTPPSLPPPQPPLSGKDDGPG